MKTLKERVLGLKNEIRQRIIDGDFEVKQISPSNSTGYVAEMVILIDGVDFKFTVAKDNYISVHTNYLRDLCFNWGKDELSYVYSAIRNDERGLKEGQIKKLQDEIRALQTK